jgi:serine/threonine-protein kinase
VLSEINRTDLPSRTLVSNAGRVFAVFDHHTQDSGNVSYGVETDAGRFFVKTAGAGTTTAFLSHGERIALLRNVVVLHRTVFHPVLPILRNVIECPDGPALVFDWIDAELVGAPGAMRSYPASAFRRFRRLPVSAILGALDSIVDLHRHLAASGWIAVDFYDGSLLYNFSTAVLHVIDLDSYHAGPFVNRMGRMFGSTRFMAPEEFELGAAIDQRTNVFMLGRTVRELLSDHPAGMLSDDLRDVSHRACLPDPSDRYPTVADFHAAWTAARRGHHASGRRDGASGIDAAG